MKAYADSKCVWGYKTLCNCCAVPSSQPKHVDVAAGGLKNPPGVGKLQQCEECKSMFVLVEPDEVRTERELRREYEAKKIARASLIMCKDCTEMFADTDLVSGRCPACAKGFNEEEVTFGR